MLLVYVDPAITGNVYIREGPSRASPSVKIPAYNYSKYGVLYEVDEVRDNSGDVWYHLRGFGWSMARYFVEYGTGADDAMKTWLVGLTRDEIISCIDYLEKALDTGGD